MASPSEGSTGPLIIACGALAREIQSILTANDLEGIDVDYLPAHLHNTPDQITARVEQRIDLAGDRPVIVAYGDCGTGGRLDELLQRRGIDRIPGAHCYQFFSGDLFERLQDVEPGTFYLTDFLTRHFDRLVWEGLGLDRHESMREFVFGNYHRLVYLAQTEDEDLTARAGAAAARLELSFERYFVGCGGLEDAIMAGNRKASG